MPVNIDALSQLMPDAVRQFWALRDVAVNTQRMRGNLDQGNRSGVTAGKNLDGFVSMVRQLVLDNGVQDDEIFTNGRVNLTVPGYYRPTKSLDLLVIVRGKLLAAIEFKSQVGPSFGNNFNNRVEEALGNATDFQTAYREGGFGESSRPFLGYVFVLDESPKSTCPVRFNSPHFKALDGFENTSYAQRYEILCRKLVYENLYDGAALILTSRQDIQTGQYRSLSEVTGIRRFAATLAGRISGMAIE